MEDIEEIENNKLLEDAGIGDHSLMDREEKRKIIKALKASAEEGCSSSSLSDTRDTSPIDRDDKQKPSNALKAYTQEGYSPSSLSDTLEENCSLLSNSEKDAIQKSLSAGDLCGSKTFDPKSSNHGNTNNALKEKEVTKSLPLKTGTLKAASAGPSSGKAGSGRSPKPEAKPAPGAAVAVRNSEPLSKNTIHAYQNQSNDNVWLEAGNPKANGVLSRKSLSLSTKKEEVEQKSEETESPEKKDIMNNSLDNCKDRESDDVIEEVHVPLMQLLFEKRNTTLLYSENRLPPLSLPKDEWVSKVGTYYFAKKASRIKAEAHQSKWITLSEKNISVMSLENAVSRASPSHAKEDGASNFTENRNMDIENAISPKARTSPEDVGESARESSPDVAVVENSPKRETINSDAGDNDAIALPDSTKKSEKIDSPQNSPSGRSVDDDMFQQEPTRRKNTRNRGRHDGKRNSRGGMQRSGSTSFNDDNSKETRNSSSAGKNFDREYSHSNEDYPPIGGGASSPYIDNTAETDQTGGVCPMCNCYFSSERLQPHAWECLGDKEENEQVADREENDITEVEHENAILTEDDDSDSDFIRKTMPSQTRKRNIFLLDDEETPPTKTPRK